MEHDDSTLSAAEIEALARRIDRPVVLVGMMGVGKTSIGRKLSALLHAPFIDADEEIEQAGTDPHFIGAACDIDRDHSHSLIPFSTLPTVRLCGPKPLLTWIGAWA